MGHTWGCRDARSRPPTRPGQIQSQRLTHSSTRVTPASRQRLPSAHARTLVSTQLPAVAPAPRMVHRGRAAPHPQPPRTPGALSGQQGQGSHSGRREAQGPIAMWVLRLADGPLEGAHTVGSSLGKHGPAQGHPGCWLEDGAWRRGLGSAGSVWRGHRGSPGDPRAGGVPAVPRAPAQVVGTAQPTDVLRPCPLPVHPHAWPGAGGPRTGQDLAVGPPPYPSPPSSGSSLPTPRVRAPGPFVPDASSGCPPLRGACLPPQEGSPASMWPQRGRAQPGPV